MAGFLEDRQKVRPGRPETTISGQVHVAWQLSLVATGIVRWWCWKRQLNTYAHMGPIQRKRLFGLDGIGQNGL